MATEYRQVTKLNMIDGSSYIALERLDAMEMKMNGLNVGKTVIQAVTASDAEAGTYPTIYVNLYHVVSLEGMRQEVPIPDTQPPVITYDGTRPFIVKYGSEFTPPEVKVTDDSEEQPVLTHDVVNHLGLVVEPFDTTQPGNYTVRFTATDAAGNQGKLSIPMVVEEYVDDIPPEIQYNGANPIVVAYGDNFTLPTVTATDNVDPSPQVTLLVKDEDGSQVQSIDTEKPGEYVLEYHAQDSSGNSSRLEVGVTVEAYVDDVPPEINYSGANPIEVEYGAEFTTPTATATDNYDSQVTVNTTLKKLSTGETIPSISTTEPGEYEVIFTAQDSAGNASEVTVGVIVGDEPEPEPEPDPEPEVPEE